MSLKKIATTATILASVIGAATLASRPASAGITIQYEAPGVQQSSLVTDPTHNPGINVVTEDFNSIIPTGYHSSSFSTNIGTFDNGLIETADQYGGAGGTGNYFDVDTSRSGNPNYTTATLTLKSPQAYLGLWWSAGDASNVLEFYTKDRHGNEQLVQRLTTQDVKAAVSSLYYGNPTSPFYGQDSSEPFAYLNFYADKGTTFDQIKFTNVGGTGFEADNFTIASSYGNTSGHSIPESSSTVGLLMIGGLGLLSQRKRVFGKA
jgi:hypothetical protein